MTHITPAAALAAAQESQSRLNAFTFLVDHIDADAPGVPIAVKDVIDVAGIVTTMGSDHFLGAAPATADASVVAALKSRGAVVIGKSNLQEFSYGIMGESSSFGPARNPWDADRIAGGSSSGSAAAVAAGIVPVALGSDTAGSIRLPAALCGVVGFKPTYGAVPMDGIFPLAPSFDTVGFVGSTLAWVDWAWRAMPAASAHTLAADASVITPVTLPDLPLDEPVARALAIAADAARTSNDTASSGQQPHAGTADAPVFPFVREAAAIYEVIRYAEAYRVHETLLPHPEKYQPATLRVLLDGDTITPELERDARRRLERLRREALDWAGSIGEDPVILLPSSPVIAPRFDELDGDIRAALSSVTKPFNVLGWPAISLPVSVPGVDLPQSVQLAALPGREDTLLGAAARLERVLGPSRAVSLG